MMIKNYIKIAFRNLVKQRVYSLINIFGLSLSLSMILLMLLWVQDEWNTDKFHNLGDRIYRVKRTVPQDVQSLRVENGIPYPVLAGAHVEFPEVEKYIPIGRPFEESLQFENSVFRESGSFANVAYFEAFSYPVIVGDIGQLDEKIDAIAISETLARKFFGNLWETRSLGETIHIHDIGDFTVEAIYEDFPYNSSYRHDFVYSFQSFLDANDWLLEWGNSGMQGAVLLAQGADPKLVGSKIEQLFHDHQEGDRKEGIKLQKYADQYLFGQFNERAEVSGGRIEYVRTFAIAAFLLLIISCINFVNLATARATKRAKEVGVRKTIGASKQSLIYQFMAESGLITGMSMAIAYSISIVCLPETRTITGKMLFIDLADPTLIAGFLGIFLITTILSGAYPAFVMSGFRPVNVLKGINALQAGNLFLRKGLVVFQFVLALLLIASAIVVKQQVEYIRHKNLGISKDNLLVIHQDAKITAQYDVLKTELEAGTAIKSLTVAGPSPLNMEATTGGVSWPGKRPDQGNIEFQILWTASNFLEVFDVPLAEGRFYREGSVYDTTTIVFNERAIEIMGLSNPVGKTIQWWGKPRQIIGVVKDFHNRSLYDEIDPMGILLDQNDAGWMFVKAEEGQLTESISELTSVFGRVAPDIPLHFEFVNEQYQRLYKNEELTGTLANYFAMISIMLSCLGLLGLATFFAEQKIKEVGIRKVLGASTFSLIGLLSSEFLTLVGIGICAGIPVAWYFMSNWLQNFEYKVVLNFWMFAAPVLITIVLATLTVGSQAIRSALVDPVESLRAE